MLPYPLQTPAIAVPDCYYVRPLLHGLHLREDLSLRSCEPDGLMDVLSDPACCCAFVSPTALLRDDRLSVLPGAGAVAREAAVSERLITSAPLEAVRTVAVAPGAAHLVDYIRVLFAERGLPQPDFFAEGDGAATAEIARLVSGDSGLAHDAAIPGHDVGALWKECTGMPMVLGLWACTPMAPYRLLRQVLGEAARQEEEALAGKAATSGAEVATKDHLYYRLLSLESDSIRTLHALARRHAICETSAESIAFC